MSAGTSGILPSATYAASDNNGDPANDVALWLSSRGGAVTGDVNVTGNLSVTGTSVLTGAVSMPGGIPVFPVVPAVAPGNAGYVTFGSLRLFWTDQTTGTDGSVTTTLPPFAGFLSVAGLSGSSNNVLVEYNTSNPAAGTIRVVCVDSVAPHAPAGAGIPVKLFGVVALAV